MRKAIKAVRDFLIGFCAVTMLAAGCGRAIDSDSILGSSPETKLKDADSSTPRQFGFHCSGGGTEFGLHMIANRGDLEAVQHQIIVGSYVGLFAKTRMIQAKSSLEAIAIRAAELAMVNECLGESLAQPFRYRRLPRVQVSQTKAESKGAKGTEDHDGPKVSILPLLASALGDAERSLTHGRWQAGLAMLKKAGHLEQMARARGDVSGAEGERLLAEARQIEDRFVDTGMARCFDDGIAFRPRARIGESEMTNMRELMNQSCDLQGRQRIDAFAALMLIDLFVGTAGFDANRVIWRHKAERKLLYTAVLEELKESGVARFLEERLMPEAVRSTSEQPRAASLIPRFIDRTYAEATTSETVKSRVTSTLVDLLGGG